MTDDDFRVNFLKKVSVDVGLLLPILCMILMMNQYLSPFRRGFYCEDNTIRYPIKKETVSLASLYLLSLGFPLIFLGMGEILFASEEDYEGDIHHVVFKWRVHKGLVRTYDMMVSFMFGFMVCVLVVIMSQRLLGVMRPNFIQTCRPDIDCLNPAMGHDYHENYTCKSSKEDEEYARLSFPSKHATFCFYTMVYLSVYLQNKVRWEYFSVFNNCMQVAFMIAAWLVSMTQLTDYYHHVGDIIAGIAIGSLVAWFNVCAVYNFFKSSLRMGHKK
ncbi:unnamed protein product [Nesidiocoris tenuis]|uniref:Uncharacterized protein n=2 Tax=Nesidiocoris tenuis TaxID=355587 RepID=A0A6H5GM91_9HEMI|nr:acidPPc [Nesidiocoris tenuis]CAB0005074.1 unnamed protein product [Nesidiocoris tenuis]